MSARDGGPAFPSPEFFDERVVGQFGGMSLRDYFAAQAMKADTAQWRIIDSAISDEYLLAMARVYFRMSDAMLKAREQC